MKVAAYFNLHKNIFSLQSRNKEDYGKVIDHSEHVILKNVKFTVRKSGNERVLNEKKKNVHAFAIGEVVDRVPPASGPGVSVTYNPYKGPNFYSKITKEVITKAEYVVLRLGLDNKPIIVAYKGE